MRTNRQPRRAPRLISRGGWVIVLALALLAWLVPAGAANAQDGSDGTGSDTGGSGSTDSGSTGSGSTGSGSTDSGGTDSSGGTRAGGLDSGGTREEGETNQPSGPVAYVNADGEVLVGIGEATPAVVGAFAALGANAQGAVAIAPTADAVAYVRSDGALVMVTTEGTDARVLATDVALDAVGANRIIGWDSTGDRLSYVAVGTEEQVADTSTRPRSRQSGTFLAPLPSGPLGNILKVVDRAGNVVSTIGDPSLRSVVGVNWSPADPVMVVDSDIPGTTDSYTLSIATEGSNELAPTTLSVDEPAFAPDGSFVVAVGPSKGLRELTRVALDDLTRTTLAIEDSICGPVVSPDATRIVFGGGTDCSRLMLVSSSGGRSFDITPLDAPDTSSFGVAELGWTTDGRFVTFPSCDSRGGQVTCSGPSNFIEPDTGRVLSGPNAVTVAPIQRPLIQDVYLDFVMRGPLELSHSFLISAETEGALTETDSGEYLEATLVDGLTEMTFRLTAAENAFVTGTVKIDDPESGINRTFTLLARGNLLGARILSASGIWMSINDLPFATGEFTMAIRRR